MKYAPDESVLKLDIGEPIELTAADFERLSSAFFDGLERKVFVVPLTSLRVSAA
jgi:hypothetical protein